MSRIATAEAGASLDHPWFDILPANLPKEVEKAFPNGVTESIGRRSTTGKWYAFRQLGSNNWFVFTPDGVLRSPIKEKRRLFKNKYTAMKAADKLCR